MAATILSAITAAGGSSPIGGIVSALTGAGASYSPATFSIDGTISGAGYTGASSKDQSRAQAIAALFVTAMQSPGSKASINAAIQIFENTSDQYYDLPEATQAYAQQALTQLYSYGWSGISSTSATYTPPGGSAGVVGVETANTTAQTGAAVKTGISTTGVSPLAAGSGGAVLVGGGIAAVLAYLAATGGV